MADYIDKNIITQAYLHLDIDNISAQELTLLKTKLTEFLRSRTDFFLYADAETQIDFRDGSLKIYANILGTVSSLYGAIALYPDFREGTQLLYSDAKRLSEYVIAESLYLTKARHKETIRLEARVGVIGSIQKINSLLISINSMIGYKPLKEINRKISMTKSEIIKLYENLKSEEDKKLVASGFLELANKLPETPKIARDDEGGHQYLAAYTKTKIILIQSISSPLK